jgi:hypothetical protein
MAWLYQGLMMRVGRGWTDASGRKYPAQWYGRTTNEEKVAAGWVWQDDPQPYDNRFYWDADTTKNIADVNEVDDDGNAILDADGNQVVTRGLKYNAVQLVKKQAADKLAETDWHVIKASEVSGYTVPAAVTTYRAAVRTASNTIETAINGAADHAAFMALYDVPVDDDGNPTGNAPINDWPDEI